MILDSLDRFSEYEKLHPLFPEALKFIKTLDFNNLTLGKVEIDGKNIFANISNSTLKESNAVKLEAHNEYIDIQIPVSKVETFGWDVRKNLKTESAPFNTTKDIIFYDDKPSTYIDVKPLNFVIFYPQDAHAPCIGEGEVVKIIIKIKA